MSLSISEHLRFTIALLVTALLFSGCSSDESILNESIAGTNSQLNNTLDSLQASLELVPDKTFRITWESTAEASFYRVLENVDGLSGFTQVGEDLDASARVLDHRVALFSRVNARYIVQACNVTGCVDSNELVVTGSLAQGIGYFKPLDGNSIYTLALSADGTTLAVGGTRVHVFERVNEHWQLQTVVGGGRISLSATGNTLVVGRISEGHTTTDINGAEILGGSQPYHGGAVYVFIRRAGAWSQQAHLLASDLGQKYYFGASVSLSADGNLLAIGAPGANSNVGAVYLFSHSNGDWTEINRLQASNPGRNDGNDTNSVFGDSFGRFLNLSGDGKTLAVSAPGEASLATGINGDQTDNSKPNKGAVYVFAHNNEIWQQEAYVKPSNTSTFFGFGGGGIDSISLSENGNTLAVGAVAENSAATGINGDQNLRVSGAGTRSGSGATYVFVRTSGAWEQQAYIKASNAGYLDHFGESISLSADGNTLAVGANHEQSAANGLNNDQNDNSAEGAGAVYVFVRSFGSWQQRAYIKASNTDSNDSFGSYITLSADGYTLAVGATGEDSAATEINGDQDDNSTTSRGAIYLY